jgi:hypothetical protein
MREVVRLNLVVDFCVPVLNTMSRLHQARAATFCEHSPPCVLSHREENEHFVLTLKHSRRVKLYSIMGQVVKVDFQRKLCDEATSTEYTGSAI